MNIDPTLQPTITKAIEALASVCDHAQARDRAGFSKATAGPGHEIAALGPVRWTEALWDYAGRLSAHHGRQLEKAGVLEEQDVARLQAFANRGHASPVIKTDWLDVDVIEGQQMLIASINGNRNLVEVLKRLPDSEAYRPAGSGRLWRISARFAFAVSGSTDEYDRMSPLVDAFIAESEAKATPEDRLLAHQGPLFMLDENKRTVSFIAPYDHELREVLRGMENAWLVKGKSWQAITYTARLNSAGVEFVDVVFNRYGGKATQDAMEAIEAARTVAPVYVEPEAPSVAMTEVDGRIHIRLSRADKAMVAAIKEIEDRKYVDGAWSVPAHSSSFVRLIHASERMPGAIGLKEPAEKMRDALLALEAADPVAARNRGYFPTISLEPQANGEKVAVTMSQYVEIWVDGLRSLPLDRRTYNGKSWIVQNSERVFDYLARYFDKAHEKQNYPAWGDEAVNVLRRHIAHLRSVSATAENEEIAKGPGL
ncbi:hypothetical protein [Rhizobium sp. MHM7A]|uniref:hypothetical protein n=1 Tax=Rhizobium sp. MHM7A TaxID=2583233 RepID=UPI001106B1C3|nr:hypothetical protein [Rhizobium sp. MHM7A]TLX16420.1 hypothetical protein FFR93_03545 [Rhizobium sp. MHM7A]